MLKQQTQFVVQKSKLKSEIFALKTENKNFKDIVDIVDDYDVPKSDSPNPDEIIDVSQPETPPLKKRKASVRSKQ